MHPSSPHCMLTFTPGAAWLSVAQGSQQPSLPSAGLQGPCPPCQSLPAPGPVPCCDPALCCCLHRPQLSKPCCQTPVPCCFCWEQGWHGGLAQTGLQTQRGDGKFIHGTRIHPFPGEGNSTLGAGRDAGWPEVVPLYPLCPVQPCPTGKTNRGSLLLAISQCPQHVPSSQGA